MDFIDPWALRLHEYNTHTVAGFGTVDDYGTLVYAPWLYTFRFYIQSH